MSLLRSLAHRRCAFALHLVIQPNAQHLNSARITDCHPVTDSSKKIAGCKDSEQNFDKHIKDVTTTKMRG